VRLLGTKAGFEQVLQEVPISSFIIKSFVRLQVLLIPRLIKSAFPINVLGPFSVLFEIS